MKNKLVSFLSTEVKNSVEDLIRTLVAKIKKVTTSDAVLTVMVTVAVRVLRSMGMIEEIHFLDLIITCHFGGKGLEVPEGISKLFAPADSKPATSVPMLKREPLPEKLVASSAPAKPVPVTAPARTLIQEKTPEQRLDGWFKILSDFVDRKRRIDPEKTCALTASVLRSEVVLVRKHWEKFFEALERADEIGFSITGKAVDHVKMFAAAPADLVDKRVFGQGGMMISTLANLSELTDKMPGWLISKIRVLMVALWAIENQLDDFGTGRVRALLTAVEGADGPESLIEEIRSLLPTADGEDDSDSRPLATATIGEILRDKETAKAFASRLQLQ